MSDLFCWKCEIDLTPETVCVDPSDHHSETGNYCKPCFEKFVEDYDGPSDDDLSEFYGGGGVRPMAEQYREAAETKRRLR
jgi:hypothetical protein